ncbi:hypothetical protein J2W42_003378 [Rhizobium tibeticum]|uniref:Uncharacterized protein n=1 Tax=Rhizobium tibeticum TaxID=501024 RepID=A0A1H8F7M7_9HYPH|nr:hypothetical protein [Rhizobium tibeticum]MDP9810517.1 hypothetical protein [Rhizobium tibeticum]SEH40632.1 hypothetical protein RTCCBAU85039_0201 [Rhizobium tibeticum]SEN27682.1 hypothetical protein SAMN05216228_1003205 [Rhizobium tibeticum]
MRSFAAGLTAAHLEQMLAPYIADRQVEASRDGTERGGQCDNSPSKNAAENAWTSSRDSSR